MSFVTANRRYRNEPQSGRRPMSSASGVAVLLHVLNDVVDVAREHRIPG